MILDSPKTGKGFFLLRLAKEFKKMGIDVITDPEKKTDITLGIGKFLFPPKGKAILRLGDCHKDTNEHYKKNNKRKAKAVKIADGVIYQSKYSKRLCNAFLGKAKVPTEIIFNGADPKEFDVPPHESPYKYNYIACTRKWTRQKRVHQIWDEFLNATIPDSCLWICGEMENKLRYETIYDNHRAVRCIEKADHKRLASLFKLCDYMIDFTYLSACPNAVVESLVAGCPVACTDQGGTKELLNQGSGFVIEDKPYDFKPINLNKPPKVDFPIFNILQHREKVLWTADHLHISTIAQQHKKFFERVLNG